MKSPIRLLLLSLVLTGCAGVTVPETPIEEAQRRMPKEPPLIVADGCQYHRNLMSFNHYLKAESRKLAEDGAKELMVGFKDHGIAVTRYAAPLMCASPLPPRGDEKDGRIAPSLEHEEPVEKLAFPVALNAVVEKDAALKAAYTQLVGDCDLKLARKKDLYDCPLLSPEQAALLKARFKTPYLVALSLAGDTASAADRSAFVALGLLLGIINVPGDEATARIRLINLETGNLVWSSFNGDFNGDSPAGVRYELSGSTTRYEDLKLSENWVKRMLKTLFEKQR